MWRKYGRKHMGNDSVRHYYRCNMVRECPAKRQRTFERETGKYEDADLGAHSPNCMDEYAAHALFTLRNGECDTNTHHW